MSMENKIEISCNNCGKKSDYVMWQSLNVQLNPEQKENVLTGKLFQFTCPHCKETYTLCHNFLYHDMENQIMIHYILDNDDKGAQEAKEAFDNRFGTHENELGELLAATGMNDAYRMRIVRSHNELKEKILIFDAGLDDRVISLLKFLYAAKNQETEFDAVLFNPTEDWKENLIFFNKGEMIGTTEMSKAVYDKFEGDFLDRINIASEGEYSFGLDWARDFFSTVTSETKEESEDDKDSDESDEHKYEGHGDHWDAVIPGSEEKFMDALRKSIEGGNLVGSKNGSHLISYIEKNKNNDDSPVTVKIVLINKDDGAELISGYPCATNGAYVHVKIEKINEWENGLEATIEGETDSGNLISFFDTDYSLHKDEYKEGESYWFSLAGIVYSAEVLEKGAADFEFTGQQAIDFKAKTGEEPDYDEEGNVKPVHFSLDNLVAFFPKECPDDAEFQSPLEGTKKVTKFFGTKLISGYKITIYRNQSEEESDDIQIPVIIAQENLEGKPREKKACRGMLWMHGHVVSDEEVEKFHKYKQWALEHLDKLLSRELNETDFEKSEISESENDKKPVTLTYEKVPFNALGRFEDYKYWDIDLIKAAIDFKKKNDKWPSAFVAGNATYDKIEKITGIGSETESETDAVMDYDDESGSEDGMYEWDELDPNMSVEDIEKLDFGKIPIILGEYFETPFFSFHMLVNDKYDEDIFRIMFGEGPGTDDGEEIPEDNIKSA